MVKSLNSGSVLNVGDHTLPDLLHDDDLPNIFCRAILPNDFKTTFSSFNSNCFSILGCNIRSCRKNFNSFVSLLSVLMLKFTVLILCETWLSLDIDYGFDVAGYNTLNIYRNNFGGGIKVFYDNRFKVELLDNLTFINDTSRTTRRRPGE